MMLNAVNDLDCKALVAGYEKEPVEDCTTQPLRKERKNTLNNGMGGM